MKSEEGLELDLESMQELCFKAIHKAWSAYTKYLKMQVIDKGLTLYCTVLGLFSSVRSIKLLEGIDEDDSRVCFSPLPDLLQTYNFLYNSQLPTNLPCFEYNELAIRQVVDRVNRVNYNSIAQAAGITETSMVYILKQIFIAIETAMRKNY